MMDSSAGKGVENKGIRRFHEHETQDSVSLHREVVTVPEVIDHLESTDATAALSANQGRVLNEKITNTATDEDIDTIFEGEMNNV